MQPHQTIQVGPLTLQHPKVLAATITNLANPSGHVTDAVTQWYQDLCRDNAYDMCIVEEAFILPEGKRALHQLGITSQCYVPGLSVVAHSLHRAGTPAILSLAHSGFYFSSYEDMAPPTTPEFDTNVDWLWRNATVNHLPIAYLEEIKNAFANAAVYADRAGFDGVEIHASDQFLLAMIYSPLSNIRHDRYGGGSGGRVQLLSEIIHAIRQTMGDPFVIGLRLPLSDRMVGGTNADDAVRAVLQLENIGLDYVHLCGGLQGPFQSLDEYLKDAVRVRNRIHIPVCLSEGIGSDADALRALQFGACDFVGATPTTPDSP